MGRVFVMKYKLKRRASKPFMHFKNNIIIELNDELVSLTGYSSKELLGKTICEIDIMFRIDSQINLENIEDEHNCYIFTKEYDPRDVTISLKRNQSENEQIYQAYALYQALIYSYSLHPNY